MSVLVIQAESRRMNPTLDEAMIDAEIAEDPEAGSSEWLGQFRASTAQYLDDELIDRAIVQHRKELPCFPRRAYAAWVDPSGGRHDAMTMGIAHREEDDRLVLDRLLIEQPPFLPDGVVARFCEAARAFGLRKVTGDAYAAEFVASMFKKWGVRYEHAELSKSEVYIECLPLFAQDRVELLDIPMLITQLRLLERRPRAGGRSDVVDHPPRANDDAANSAAGALWLASKLSKRAVLLGGAPRQEYAIQ